MGHCGVRSGRNGDADQDVPHPTAVTPTTPTRRSPAPPSEFDLFFLRAYPAAVGLAQRVLDRDRVVPDGSAALASDIATEALTRARVRRLPDTDASINKVLAWTADLCVGHLVGHPGRVALPQGAQAADLLPEDLLDEGIGAEWRLRGLPLAELQVALSGSRRVDRRVGLVCLGAGLTPLQASAALGMDREAVGRSLRRVGTRLADRRRIDSGLLAPADAPAEDVA